MATLLECPICFNENIPSDSTPICPNGHNFCGVCLPQIQCVRSWQHSRNARSIQDLRAACPMCRGPIPFVPTPEQLEEQARHDAQRAQNEAQRLAAVAAHAERREQLRARRDARLARAAERNARPAPPAPQDAREAQVDAIMNQRMAEVARELGVPHLAPAPQARPAHRVPDPLHQDLFDANVREGRIPANAIYGGIHHRRCGAEGCLRTGGQDGVRFLRWNGGSRRYRCELHQNV